MKVNSAVFLIIALSLVAGSSYYIGATKHSVNSVENTKTSVPPSLTSNNLDQNSISPSQVASKSETTQEQNNQKILTSADAKPPISGVITGASQTNKQIRTILPSPPIIPTIRDEYDILQIKYETYKAMALQEYEIDMFNAGAIGGKSGDPYIVQMAKAKYTLNMAKIEGWHNEIQNGFRMIDSDQQSGPIHKRQARLQLLDKVTEPIDIPTYERRTDE